MRASSAPSPLERGVDGDRHDRPQRGQVVGEEHQVDERDRRDPDPVRAPAGVVGGGPQRPRAEAGHELGQLRARVRGQAGPRAQRSQRGAHGAEAGGEERVGIVGVDDRVEDHALDVLRVGARVRDRELGAVGDAEQGELVHAELGADRLHVLHRIRRRVVPAGGADPLRALRGRHRVAQPRVALELRAAQEAGAAGSALVVADHPVGLQELGQRGEHAQHLVEPGSSRAAGEVHERPPGVAPDAADAQPDRAGVGAGAVERDAQRGAADPVEVDARTPAQRRLGGVWERDQRSHGEQHGKDCSAEHGVRQPR